MSLQKISVAASAENALPPTFTPGKSKMAIEPALADQTGAKTRRVAGLAHCAWGRACGPTEGWNIAMMECWV